MTHPVVYTTAFDVTAAGYRDVVWTVLGLLFIAVAVGVVFYDTTDAPAP